MAKHFLSALLISACIAQQVSCCEGEHKKYLSFELNNELAIMGAFAHGMELYKPLEESIGKKLSDVLPFSSYENGYPMIVTICLAARDTDKTEKVECILDHKRFVAKAVPFFNNNQDGYGANFSIKFKAQAENQ